MKIFDKMYKIVRVFRFYIRVHFLRRFRILSKFKYIYKTICLIHFFKISGSWKVHAYLKVHIKVFNTFICSMNVDNWKKEKNMSCNFWFGNKMFIYIFFLFLIPRRMGRKMKIFRVWSNVLIALKTCMFVCWLTKKCWKKITLYPYTIS